MSNSLLEIYFLYLFFGLQSSGKSQSMDNDGGFLRRENEQEGIPN